MSSVAEAVRDALGFQLLPEALPIGQVVALPADDTQAGGQRILHMRSSG